MSNFTELKAQYDLAILMREQVLRDILLNGETTSRCTKRDKLMQKITDLQQEIQKELGLCDE